MKILHTVFLLLFISSSTFSGESISKSEYTDSELFLTDERNDQNCYFKMTLLIECQETDVSYISSWEYYGPCEGVAEERKLAREVLEAEHDFLGC